MKHDGNLSSNAAAEQVFIMHFVIILHVRSQENVCLFRNTFDTSWVNVYWVEVMWFGFFAR